MKLILYKNFFYLSFPGLLDISRSKYIILIHVHETGKRYLIILFYEFGCFYSMTDSTPASDFHTADSVTEDHPRLDKS